MLFESNYVTCKYIGQGNKAYSYLNLLEADLLAMTTPGLDVLQIKRSKRVQHYTYIQHAPTDGTYKTFSFDYFDSVLCSGEHQINFLRHLEQQRGLPAKQLIHAGYPYLDTLIQRKSALPASLPQHQKPAHILIAPTWGANNLLRRFGLALIEPLLAEGYRITIRPHPQSFISEREFILNFKAQLMPHEHITWDENPDNFTALATSDMMISDISGVIFDYAFAFEKAGYYFTI